MKRFFAEGEQRRHAKTQEMESFYYTRDHLGSIRELTDANGNLRARYDYDVWGNSVVLEGDTSLDFGYTGHYFHAPSGLNLTLYRAYNPTLGRWLSRDPIAENGGLNLYQYTFSNPVNFVDPLGLDVRNNSPEWIAVVPEDNLDGTRLLAPRDTYRGRQEGFYVADTTGLGERNYYKNRT